MAGGLFPKQFDNNYRGQWLALALLALIAFVKAAMGANTVLRPWFVIATADGVPLQSFDVGAQETIVFIYQAWGLCIFLISALGFVALFRYRSMTPLVFLLLGAENIARRVIFMIDPFSYSAPLTTPSIGAIINYALIMGLVLGFVLSLWNRKDAAPGRR